MEHLLGPRYRSPSPDQSDDDDDDLMRPLTDLPVRSLDEDGSTQQELSDFSLPMDGVGGSCETLGFDSQRSLECSEDEDDVLFINDSPPASDEEM